MQGKTQALFEEIAAAARAAKPAVVVSLAPSTASFSAANYCADWPKWLASTDEVLPQVYRSTYSSFATDWAAQITASGTNRPELGAGLPGRYTLPNSPSSVSPMCGATQMTYRSIPSTIGACAIAALKPVRPQKQKPPSDDTLKLLPQSRSSWSVKRQ